MVLGESLWREEGLDLVCVYLYMCECGCICELAQVGYSPCRESLHAVLILRRGVQGNLGCGWNDPAAVVLRDPWKQSSKKRMGWAYVQLDPVFVQNGVNSSGTTWVMILRTHINKRGRIRSTKLLSNLLIPHLSPHFPSMSHNKILFLVFEKEKSVYFMYMSVLPVYTYGAYGGQKRTSDPRNWSYLWLWISGWVLGKEHRSSIRAARALNDRTISLVLLYPLHPSETNSHYCSLDRPGTQACQPFTSWMLYLECVTTTPNLA